MAAGAEQARSGSERGGLPAMGPPGPVDSRASNPNAKPNANAKQTTTLTLWLRVENNSEFVRGKTTVRERIETDHLHPHAMKKLHGWEYELTVWYEDDADLDRQVGDLLGDLAREADLRNCFIEWDLCEQGTDRSW